jgi:hypothetical protein
VRRTWSVAPALTIVMAALALPAPALPQALIIGTTSQPGNGELTVSPFVAEQQNDDTTVSASAGSDSGSAATARTQDGDDRVSVIVGCIDGTVAHGDSALTGSAGNCRSGSGRAAKADTTRDDPTAGAGLGCITLSLVGLTSGSAQAGSCEGATRGDDSGGGPGSGGDDSGDDGGSGGTAGGGVAGESAGSAGPNGFRGSSSGGGEASSPCSRFNELASLTGPGSVPVWMLALGTLVAFASGAVLTRRRSGSSAG